QAAAGNRFGEREHTGGPPKCDRWLGDNTPSFSWGDLDGAPCVVDQIEVDRPSGMGRQANGYRANNARLPRPCLDHVERIGERLAVRRHMVLAVEPSEDPLAERAPANPM